MSQLSGRKIMGGQMIKAVTVLAVLAVGISFPQEVAAKPQHKAAVTSYYGDLVPQNLRSCQLCHLSDKEIEAAPPEVIGDEAQPWNSFGRALVKLGIDKNGSMPIADRLRALADADADGDGIANEVEIIAGTQPGNSEDRPSDEVVASVKVRQEKFRRVQPNYSWNPTARVVRAEVPAADKPDWIKNPIDVFVAAEHARQGITPRPEASKEILLRRIYIDLIGLPPTRDELIAFLADDSADAYEKVVNRLLDSPQYGERWGRHWMDVWRYSDWAGWGEQVRDSHPHIWRWRDWIIESLNADKPYDQMVVEMLAADEAKPGDENALRGTGFLVRNFKLLSREQWMLDTVDHTSRAFLGVTFKCAQCHDHMYDPLTQEEYFRFRAVFEPYQVRIDQVSGQLDTKKDGLSRVYDADPEAKTAFYIRGDERTPDKDRTIVPGVPKYLKGGQLMPQPMSLSPQEYHPALRKVVVDELLMQAEAKVGQQQKALNEAKPEETEVFQARLNAAQADLASLKARVVAEQAKYVENKDEAALKQLATEASRLERQGKLAAADFVLIEARQALAVAEHAKDDKGEVGEKQQQAIAAAKKKVEEAEKARAAAAETAQKEDVAYQPLGTIYSKTSSGRRLALAKWITHRDNPLAARVAVNHIWARHFGRGLVETVDDFGNNGRRPSHPALLDWLAAELMEPSQASVASPAQPWSMKHIHRLIVLTNTYRLSPAYDAASAEIDPDNRYFWRTTPRRIEAEAVRDSVLHLAGSLDGAFGGPEIDQNQALKVARRTLYFRHAPEKQAQFMQIFDTAAPNECYRRRDSVIPQQALALANSELTVKLSRKLARALAKDASDSKANFIKIAFQQILTREPTVEEATECEAFLAEQTERFTKQPGSVTTEATNLDLPGNDPTTHARENLIHVLMNHHDFVTLK